MDLDVLNSFIAVVEEGNMTRAADRLHISQSAVSVAIGKLEKELETSLFDRAGKNLQLTREGEFFLSWARRMERALGEGERHMKELVSTTGVVRIGNWAENDGIYYLISAFCKKYPQIEVHLHEGQVAWSDLRNSDLDFFVVPEGEAQGLPGLRIARRSNLYVLMGTGHPLAHKAVLRLEELAGERFAFSATDEGKMDPLYHYCLEQGVVPQVSFLCEGLKCMLDLLAQTGAVTLAYNTFRQFRQSMDGIVAVPLDQTPEQISNLFLVWKEEPTPIADIFRQFAQDYFTNEYRRI